MSKSGLIGRFGDKEAMQRAVLAAAIERFTEAVWQPAERAAPGLPRLEAIVDAWITHLRDGVFPGGCFVTTASVEYDARPGACATTSRTPCAAGCASRVGGRERARRGRPAAGPRAGGRGLRAPQPGFRRQRRRTAARRRARAGPNARRDAPRHRARIACANAPSLPAAREHRRDPSPRLRRRCARAPQASSARGRARRELVAHCLLIEGDDGLVLVDTGLGTGDIADPGRLGRLAIMRPAARAPRAPPSRGPRARPRPRRRPPRPRSHTSTSITPAAWAISRAPRSTSARRARDRPPAPGRRRRATGPHSGPTARAGSSTLPTASRGSASTVRVLEAPGVEVALIPLHGHTAGHSGYAIRRGDGWLLHCGDAYLHHEEVAAPPACSRPRRVYHRLNSTTRRRAEPTPTASATSPATTATRSRCSCSHDPGRVRATDLTPLIGAGGIEPPTSCLRKAGVRPGRAMPRRGTLGPRLALPRRRRRDEHLRYLLQHLLLASLTRTASIPTSRSSLAASRGVLRPCSATSASGGLRGRRLRAAASR